MKDGGDGWTRDRAVDSVLGSPCIEMLATIGLLAEPGRGVPSCLNLRNR
jgi:hypothetical protein